MKFIDDAGPAPDENEEMCVRFDMRACERQRVAQEVCSSELKPQ